MNGEILYSSPNNNGKSVPSLGLKRQRTSSNNNSNANVNRSLNSLENQNADKDVAEVNLTELLEQVLKFGIGNERSPGSGLSPSLENLPVIPPGSPVGTPSLPYRNLYKKPLRRFGSLPLAAMGALGPSPSKKIRSMSNVKGRRKTRRMNRKSRKSRRGTTR